MALEIEAKFLEIDKEKLVAKLKSLNAEDRGEDLLTEIIIYDKDFKFLKEHKFIRLRKIKDKCFLSYKHHKTVSVDGTEEVELQIESMDKGVT
jgi:adenylate cyclase class IV